ncbi:quinone oxidoreductase [Bradyrhizobium prioriisuperbiae]|uniref:quinone oxidoreductase family protein n=1 Tax=Bradyrhizobium prioriisuperbiae TaxID=2854389 RepID=UPI0028EB0C61|nr:quinone oxidoreductase [Bradyrhizobium prioritasuperba]
MAHRVRIYEQGAPSVLRYEETSVGEPGPQQVRLKQEAVGVNFVDTMFRDGKINVSLPFALGVEAAGIVEAVGEDVADLKPGDRVAYWFSLGSYADIRLVDVSALVKLPADISTEQAAAVFAKGLTAWMLVKRVHVVRSGEFVLVQAAAGGVGSLVASWARALGATVIATVGSPAKADSVRQRGIESVLHAGDPDLVTKIRTITGGKGVDVVYELVGAATFSASVSALRDGGDLIHLGNASGSPSVDKEALAARSIHYVQPSTGQFVKDRGSLEESSAELFAALQDDVFGEIAITRYLLRDVAQAHEDIAARRISGAIILTP